MAGFRDRIDRFRTVGRVHAAHIGHETIAPAGQGLDEARRLGIVPERRADLLDAVVEPLLHVHVHVVRPERRLDFVARDEVARAVQEHRKDLERLVPQVDQAAFPPQFARLRVEIEDAEPKAVAGEAPVAHCPRRWARGFNPLDRGHALAHSALPALAPRPAGMDERISIPEPPRIPSPGAGKPIHLKSMGPGRAWSRPSEEVGVMNIPLPSCKRRARPRPSSTNPKS